MTDNPAVIIIDAAIHTAEHQISLTEVSLLAAQDRVHETELRLDAQDKRLIELRQARDLIMKGGK